MFCRKQYCNMVRRIIDASLAVHSEMGYGLLDSVYLEALHLELLDRSIENVCGREIVVHYKRHTLENRFKMNLVVGDIVVELKSEQQITQAHRAELQNILRLTKKPLGLIINFGEELLFGERWAYERETNHCLILDKNMDPVFPD